MRAGFALTCVIALATAFIAFQIGRCSKSSGYTPQSVSTPEASEWPSLTQNEIADWAKALRPYPIKEIDVFWGHEVKADQLFYSLKAVGRKLGVNVETGLGKGNPNEIEVDSRESDPVGNILFRLFKNAGFPVKLKHTRSFRDEEILISIGDKS